ncbi:MAG TPA: hypothetical protein VE753_04070 [Gaiellaceae bacterium]|jgi:hypothetical protein|nr:hypothetical protein [Gaiellaceae bacterium]
MRFIAALVVPGLIVLALAYGETRLLDRSPPSSPAQATGIVWAGRTFANRAEFSRWLRARGTSYRIWAQRHPERAGIKPRRAAKRAARGGAKSDHGPGFVLAGLGVAAAALAVLCLALVVRVRRRRTTGAVVRTEHVHPPARVAAEVPRAGRRSGPAVPSIPRPARAVVFRRIGRGAAVLASRGPILVREARRRLRGAGTGLLPARHGVVTRRAAAAAGVGARRVLRWATATALLSSALAATATVAVRRKRGDLAWYLATAVLAVVASFLLAAWLNRG